MKSCPLLLLVATLLAGLAPLRADVTMSAIFGDHMVLQEGMTLPIWGRAAPGEAVTVTIGSVTQKTTASRAGKWRVDLPSLPTNATPVTLTVTGKNTLTFNDVLVGEVWLCSGQSNMAFSLGGGKVFGGASNAATVVPQANDPQLRFFQEAKKTSLVPLSDEKGVWVVCTPDTASPFSAVAYFFGHELRHSLQRPVGLIGSYWGGTPAQAWTSLEGLKKEPALQHYVDAEAKTKAHFAQAKAAYPAQMAALHAEQAAWQTQYGNEWDAKMKAWQATPHPPGTPQLPPRPGKPMPRGPMPPDGGAFNPSNLYNGMIAPLIPYAIKGVIWYQGEANAGAPHEYRTLFPAMITDWRAHWGEGDFPFLFVQLTSLAVPPPRFWPLLREAQLKTLSLPNTAMATTIDVGEPHNLHPHDKEDVGKRLEIAALHVAYGQDLVYSGPVYQSMTSTGNAIHLKFTNEGSGLTIGQAPWIPEGSQPIPTTSLVGFTIAGADQKFVPATATIEKDEVVVSSPEVSAPVAVRYAWANLAIGNLYNKENLPAPPFRTDDWKVLDDVKTVDTPFKAEEESSKP